MPACFIHFIRKRDLLVSRIKLSAGDLLCNLFVFNVTPSSAVGLCQAMMLL